MNKIKTLLIKFLNNKVTWLTRSLSIHLVTADIVPKEYLIYHLDIISVIKFFICYQAFISHLA